MRRWAAALCLLGCQVGLQGERAFTVGQAQLVPCVDDGGEQGAMMVIESLQECWTSFPGERLTCDQRRQLLAENPRFCSGGLVMDSPSRSNLTGFMGRPIDPSDYRGAGTVQVFNLPCNPAGPGAENYDNFQDFVEVFTGEVLVTQDEGTFGRVSLNLSLEGSSEPAIVGETRIQICR